MRHGADYDPDSIDTGAEPWSIFVEKLQDKVRGRVDA